LAAAQRATEWAQKFALRLTFLASQKEVEGIVSKEVIIMGEILQSIFDEEWFIAWMTTAESPSRMNLSKLKEQAKEIANCAVKASPSLTEQGELIREDKCRIFPSEFLHTAA
jgi:desulfoferrodoxin (superoxide reductase-like protein)